MTKQPVNPYFAVRLFDPLAGLADDDDALEIYIALDPNDEVAVRGIIRDLLKPEFNRWDDRSQAAAKLALRYLLSFKQDWCGPLFDSILPPFDPPADPALLYKWIWRELFGDEDYRLSNQQEYIVVRDIHAPNLIGRRLS